MATIATAMFVVVWLLIVRYDYMITNRARALWLRDPQLRRIAWMPEAAFWVSTALTGGVVLGAWWAWS